MSGTTEARIRARLPAMAEEDIAPLAALVAMLDEAAEALRAPLPVSAEPAAVLVLPARGGGQRNR